MQFLQTVKKYKEYKKNLLRCFWKNIRILIPILQLKLSKKIQYKFNQDVTKYYFIMSENVKIGVIRLVSIDETTMRISPVMILPEYQNKGFAQKTFYEMEKKYPYIKVWQLDTIKQEEKLCYLYEKLGYTKTGREEDIKQGMTIIYYQKVIK